MPKMVNSVFLKCESAFNQEKGEGPSRGLLRDCTTSPINRFAALVDTMAGHWALNEVDCVPVTRVQAAQKAAQSPSRVPVGIHQIS